MSRKLLLSILIGQEIFLIIVSAIWLYFFTETENLPKYFIDYQSILIGGISAIFLVLLSFLLINIYSPLKKSLEILDDLVLNKIKFQDSIPIALLSGFGEELFFRGVLQNSIGLIPSSVIFALLHLPSKDFFVYSLWTFFASLYLGNIYNYTDNLFIVIFAHVLNNFITLAFWSKFKKFLLKK